jgi:hypothetical protein
MTTQDMEKLLAAKYAAPNYAFILQVRNGTGAQHTIRTADAIAMGLWPSQGLHLHGFEIKVSRADWLKERKEPSKAEEIAQYCDFWWVVIADQKLIQPGELPENWGLLVPSGGKLIVAKQACRLEPVQIGRPFLAAVMRRLAETVSNPADIAAAVNEARSQERKRAEENAEFHKSSAERERDRLQKRIEEFEAASGIKIMDWNAGRLGEAVKLIIDHGPDAALRSLDRIRDIAKDILVTCDGLQPMAAKAKAEMIKRESAQL